MEELNKNQLVLLVILVSFVVSIATGVLTVSLLVGDPTQSVGQTITRVVEKTIERVIPGETKTIVKEPVVITEEELVVQTIASASSSVVTVYPVTTPGMPVGIGFAVSPDLVVTTGVLPQGLVQYQISLNGQSLAANLVGTQNGINILQFVPVDPKYGPNLVPVKLSTQSVSVGQSVVAVGTSGGAGDQAAVGVVTGLTGTSTVPSALIKTRAATADLLGGPLFNTHSEVVGIVNAAGTAIPAKYIQALVDSLKK
jgi:S1-C subfamily serine protease